jgi:hypothetical protein
MAGAEKKGPGANDGGGLGYKPFYPHIQRLDRSFRVMKWGALFVILWTTFWSLEGRALYRRYVIGIAKVPERARTGEGFVAISFPLVTKRPERFTISLRELDDILSGLRRQGFVSIGLDDVRDFYAKDRPLPPKSVLLVFERDALENVLLADKALERHRMRGVLFLDRTLPKDPEQRKKWQPTLNDHMVAQLAKGGAWEFGWVADAEPRRRRGEPLTPIVLDYGEEQYAWTRNPYRFPLRLLVSRGGYNDANRMPWALKLYRARAGKTPAEIIQVVTSSLPRTREFVDDFQKDGLGLDWIAERGVVVAIGKRLVVVPTPRQTSASVYLSGTDWWRDMVVEWELKRYRKDAWVYARGSEKDDRWLRVGVLDGYWTVQEKVGGEKKLRTLGKAPMTIATSLPARVRLVLKGPWAIVHVNGRMQYGKALRVHSGIDQGRVEIDAYDTTPGKALGVFGFFAAAPLGSHWLSISRDGIVANSVEDQKLLDGVREHAVYASVLSPRWLDVLADGRVMPTDDNRELVRSLAGYYRCQLVPMVDFAAPAARLPGDRADADRMIDEVLASLRGSEATGLNVRLSAARAAGAQTDYFLSHLKARLHQERRRLYITVDGAPRGAPWLREADGVLRATSSPVRGAAVLETLGPGGKPGPA